MKGEVEAFSRVVEKGRLDGEKMDSFILFAAAG